MSDEEQRREALQLTREMDLDELAVAYVKLREEMARLQTVIDSRPAINAGLPDSYIKWSQSIYTMEAAHILRLAN